MTPSKKIFFEHFKLFATTWHALLHLTRIATHRNAYTANESSRLPHALARQIACHGANRLSCQCQACLRINMLYNRLTCKLVNEPVFSALMFCFARYKAWNTRPLGRNSGTASRPPLHPISLIDEMVQAHTTPVWFDGMRTGHGSAVVGRCLAVASIVPRHRSIRGTSTWTSDVQERRFNRPCISRRIISASAIFSENQAQESAVILQRTDRIVDQKNG